MSLMFLSLFMVSLTKLVWDYKRNHKELQEKLDGFRAGVIIHLDHVDDCFWKLDILEELYYQKGFAVEDIKRDIDNIKREIEDITREIEEYKIAIEQVNIYI